MAEYLFKTVYFPPDRVRGGGSARVTVSVPTADGLSKEFIAFFAHVSSRELRLALGDPFIEDIEKQAHDERRSLSSICTRKLLEYFDNRLGSDSSLANGQLPLAFIEPSSPRSASPMGGAKEPTVDLGITFRDSLRQGVFGWYPYVEGFSATYTRDAILRYRPRMVFDPFGGSGTTQLASACLGIPSAYSEVNPFMRFVAETKVSATRWARANLATFEAITTRYLRDIRAASFARRSARVDLSSYEAAFPERDFFEEQHIRDLLAAVDLARNTEEVSSHARDILLLACASNAVRASNMTRRADLRRRRPDEYKTRVVNVRSHLSETLARFVNDIKHLPLTMASTTFASEDIRALPDKFQNAFDFALTSPPYLNGTNYFRNTKIELWLMGFIKSEDELARYRRQAIAAGINNVSRDRVPSRTFPRVEEIVAKLEIAGGDRRIPLLVRHYFSDMCEMFIAVHRGLRPGGVFLLDIGDSKFYGVHVPTDHLLVDAAASAGLELKARNVLARRHSRDKSPLIQVELVLEKPNVTSVLSTSRPNGDKSLEKRAAEFQRSLPYKTSPFTKRNWGHGLHSLCSYQGKLKPAIAHWLVKCFTTTGARILDPLGGVGTIPLEAAMLGHSAISNDMSPFAATVAKAKLAPPSISDAERRLKKWWRSIEAVPEKSLDYKVATFGLNGAVKDYYHEGTLLELLKARKVFLARNLDEDSDAFIWASLLHVLHGNRPYALSRTSHPITPFHPRGPYVYKSLEAKVRDRVTAALRQPMPKEFQPGKGVYGDFRALDADKIGKFDAIITSPPFLGMRFDRPNWLRLWFCGWGESDFHQRSLAFLERQQMSSANVYVDFFQKMRSLANDSAVLIIHVGTGGSRDLANELKKLGDSSFKLRAEVIENVQAIEQHGIRDKGLTTQHHFLFFTPL